jgi:DNA-binding MarR family transcriptional regulator
MSDNLPVQVLLDRIKKNWGAAASPETDIVFAVVRFYELIRRRTDQALDEFELTPAAFEILVSLRAQPVPRQLTPTQLYRSVLLSSGGTTKVLNSLEDRGLIKRAPNPHDARSKIVKLTSAGARLAQKAMAAVMKQDKLHFAAFERENEISDLRDVTMQMIAKIENPR